MISVNPVVEVAKSFRINGEPGQNRTHNQQIMISVVRVVDVAESFGINGEPGGSRTHNLFLGVLSRRSKPSID